MNVNDGSGFIISKAVVEDANGIVDFLNTVGGETDFLTFGLNEFPISVEEEKAFIAECIEQEMCLMLVAKIHDEVISQLFLERSSVKRLRHVGTIAISVSKQHWGKSIGKKMILTALDWAKSQHISKLQLAVRSDNTSAIKLYEKLGFVTEGTMTRAVLINGAYFDNHLMGLEL